MKGPKDPVDHTRTTRPHAGVSMKDNVIMPPLILIALGLVLFVACLAAFATGHADVGLTVGALSGAVMTVSALWLALEHVRVRRIEQRWYAAHPEATRQKPNS